jgi:hypothetical protein
LDETFLYHNKSLVYQALGKFIKEVVNLNNDVETERRNTNHHLFISNYLTTKIVLKPTFHKNKTSGLGFRLRLAASFLSTKSLKDKQTKIQTIEKCPIFNEHVIILDKHLFNSCRPPDDTKQPINTEDRNMIALTSRISDMKALAL